MTVVLWESTLSFLSSPTLTRLQVFELMNPQANASASDVFFLPQGNAPQPPMRTLCHAAAFVEPHAAIAIVEIIESTRKLSL